ncbi:MAG: DNA-directed RNA polymerase subunit omega [Melioribacteraceae bacterium]|jgi:DNA-directed RNA polymerase subunit K/omega|nr:DNA-directed RNA polymerase subunit omega [Melioribacteraceae bacterium]RJP57189.1 MAG: DNA-directed RNA polymerase subunit omega [Ignavibacteriales bacterium]WKZ68721.1 MAG: DNA-directed RNA polymerase subunit omega [Melioribacteraceae bacterium]
MPIRPIELSKLETETANIYEAVIVAAKKARIINDQTKLEFKTLVDTMNPGNDDEFEEKENPDQLKLSLEFESRNKPHLQALEQLTKGEIEFRYKDEEA